MKHTALTFLLALIVIAGANLQMNSQTNEDEKVINYAETMTDEANGVKVTFLAVVSDSRCPEGVDCFRAGNAVVRVKFNIAGDSEPQIHEFDTDSVDEVLKIGSFAIKFISLDPYPKDNVETKITDYKLRLTIKKTE